MFENTLIDPKSIEFSGDNSLEWINNGYFKNPTFWTLKDTNIETEETPILLKIKNQEFNDGNKEVVKGLYVLEKMDGLDEKFPYFQDLAELSVATTETGIHRDNLLNSTTADFEFAKKKAEKAATEAHAEALALALKEGGVTNEGWLTTATNDHANALALALNEERNSNEAAAAAAAEAQAKALVLAFREAPMSDEDAKKAVASALAAASAASLAAFTNTMAPLLSEAVKDAATAKAKRKE